MRSPLVFEGFDSGERGVIKFTTSGWIAFCKSNGRIRMRIACDPMYVSNGKIKVLNNRRTNIDECCVDDYEVDVDRGVTKDNKVKRELFKLGLVETIWDGHSLRHNDRFKVYSFGDVRSIKRRMFYNK